MQWLELLIGGLIGLATSLGLIPVILKLGQRHGLGLRVSEAHHTNQIPVPRLGGLALVSSLGAVVLVFSFLEPGFFQNHQRWLIISGALAMFGLGFWDDLAVLGARRKLFGQLLIASVVYFCGVGIIQFRVPFTQHDIDLGLWAWPVTVFWLVAMTNLINLIDGVDGLAGGICLMLMILLVYVSWQITFVAIIAAGMVGALLGFLRFNFPPARIYLGDGGAYLLGFLIGCLTIASSQKGTVFAALAAPLFVLALPIIDTSLAILRRSVQGLPVFRPDRKHLHHRLLNQGYSRRSVVLGLYAFTAFFLLLGFAAFYWHGQYFALFLGIGTLAVILAAGRFSFSREWFSIGRVLGNSLESRAEIQYAMSLTRWLALEGTRAQTVEDLAADVAFIARKLGYARLRIRLEDDEKTWGLTGAGMEHATSFLHKLPGRKYCFLELSVAARDPVTDSSAVNEKGFEAALNTLSIKSELVAEAWAKAVADWIKCHKLPARFDGRPKPETTSDVIRKKSGQPISESIPPVK